MVNYIPRELEKEVLPWLDSPHIIAIRGPRQSGKTTFLRRIQEVLQQQGISQQEIHFISFEDALEVENFSIDPRKYIAFHCKDRTKKNFFLLDEVQYVEKAGKLLKLVYDLMENIKIILTGSSTLDINEVSSYLVGRALLFEMYPFSFSEFLQAKDQKMFQYHSTIRINLQQPRVEKEPPLFLKELNQFLLEYLTYGGYPEIILENDLEKKKILLKNIFLTYVEKDIVRIYGPRYRQKVIDLVRHLAFCNGGILNYNDLAALTSLYAKEIKEILSILQDTYIITLLRPFHQNLSTELRKNPKVYMVDTGLRNFMADRFSFGPEEYGKLLENYVWRIMSGKKINYWRTTSKAEVDFIINMTIPMEVKMTPKISKSFRSFIESYHPPQAFLATLDGYGMEKIEKTTIYIVPLALL